MPKSPCPNEACIKYHIEAQRRPQMHMVYNFAEHTWTCPKCGTVVPAKGDPPRVDERGIPCP